jgi:hypothetical protein
MKMMSIVFVSSICSQAEISSTFVGVGKNSGFEDISAAYPD